MGVLAPKLQMDDGRIRPVDHYDPETILSAVLDTATGVIAADAYAVWLMDTASGIWHVSASRGLSPEYAAKTVPASSYQLTKDPIYAEDVGSSSILDFRSELYEREGIRSLMAVPLSIREVCRGTLVFYFRKPHKFTDAEVQQGSSLARLASSALATAELYHEQLQAKNNSDFLAQASAVFTSSLDYKKAIAAVAQLAVPYLADLCTVDVLESGSLKRLAVTHVDATRIPLLTDIFERFSPEGRSNSMTAAVMARGKSYFVPDADDILQSVSVDDEHFQILRDLKIRSVLLVPLQCREQISGVLTLATIKDSGRTFKASQQEAAHELARRAAVTLENSRLFGALQHSEQKFRAISEAAACAVFIFDGKQVLYANHAAERLLGYTLREYGNQDVWQLVHPDDRELVRQRALSQLAGDGSVLRQEVRVLRRDGKVLWLDVTSTPLQYSGQPALIATGFDITDRKNALQQLEHRELEARTLLNSIPDYIARFDRDLRYLYKSPHLETASSLTADRYIGKTFRELDLPSEIIEVWENALRNAFQSGRPKTLDYSLRGLDGIMRHYVAVVSPEITREGFVETVMTVTRDITEQRKAAERLLQNEKQLRLIIDSMPGLVAYIDSNEVFRLINRTYDEWYGKPTQSFVGKRIEEVIVPENYARVKAYVRRALDGNVVQFETTILYNGIYRDLLATYVPDIDETGEVRGFVSLAIDVTKQRKSEEALRKSEKLAAAGRLAASIAHEINNPLESVTNLLFLLAREPQLTESGRQYLAMAEQELARVTQIATQTLRFHRQSTKPVLTTIEDVIDAVAALYQRRMIVANIRLERRYRDVGPIHTLEGELRQLLANLIGNAVDATPAGGKIVISTRKVRKADGLSGVRITLADSGHGIPAELLSRIFEPFVTTKSTTGTGLGLWVSREIVEKHQGTIRVRSRADGPQTGTIFSVFVADLKV